VTIFRTADEQEPEQYGERAVHRGEQLRTECGGAPVDERSPSNAPT